jgi:Protein of unknown function (DUF4239)
VSAMAIAWIVFGCIFSGALLGIYLRTALPEHHLSAETKDVVKVAVALIATISALVVSLMISSAKSAYDTRSTELLHASADLVALDRTLARYGPESKEARALLHHMVEVALERIWPTGGGRPVGMDPTRSPADSLYDKIAELVPQTDAQRARQTQALNQAMDLARTRMFLFAQQASSIPAPFLVVLVFWLTVIFASFGLFAPANATVMAVFLVCGLSISGAIFLILELDQSFTGLIQISSAPLRQALAHLGQ